MTESIAGLGPMTGEAVGVILKELVRRAITLVRAQRISYEVHGKQGYDGGEDVFTSADTAAQAVFVKLIRECLPNVGILGEEGALNVEPQNGCRVYVTIDPIDGTRAFIRNQSHGIGSMIALVEDGEVLSAWIGDVNTQEIYGYRPGSTKTHRISEYSISQYLQPQTRRISGAYIMLRDPLGKYSRASHKMAERFKNHEVSGGSIGIWFARLWKHEAAALLMLPGKETPWDSAPVIGISKHLDYAFLKPTTSGSWTEYDPQVALTVIDRDHETLVIHRAMMPQLLENGSK